MGFYRVFSEVIFFGGALVLYVATGAGSSPKGG